MRPLQHIALGLALVACSDYELTPKIEPEPEPLPAIEQFAAIEEKQITKKR